MKSYRQIARDLMGAKSTIADYMTKFFPQIAQDMALTHGEGVMLRVDRDAPPAPLNAYPPGRASSEISEFLTALLAAGAHRAEVLVALRSFIEGIDHAETN